MKEYSELMGFKKKEEVVAPTSHSQVMKVYVRGDGSLDDWEAQAVGQQEGVQREAAEHASRT